jgi:hypothetical protein
MCVSENVPADGAGVEKIAAHPETGNAVQA